MSKKDQKSALEFEKYLNQKVRVKLTGGREVTGILKGHDPISNLVLDEAEEYLRDPKDPYTVTKETRKLGLIVARGTSVMLLCPVDGCEEIQTPFCRHNKKD
eukprot:GEMP01102722.1.p1 GENE.GEMP01102722.1~~GEMP01102722.1.p1  ORF type:complete len:102 (+),score=9.73 GEMP01102722.1:57-362(+)